MVDDGYVTIKGRNSDLIVSGGYNVYPVEIEDVLLRHPAVAEAAVTGTPSDEWGETVTAWVVADGRPPSRDQLLTFAAGLLAPDKRPPPGPLRGPAPSQRHGEGRRVDLRSA